MVLYACMYYTRVTCIITLTKKGKGKCVRVTVFRIVRVREDDVLRDQKKRLCVWGCIRAW